MVLRFKRKMSVVSPLGLFLTSTRTVAAARAGFHVGDWGLNEGIRAGVDERRGSFFQSSIPAQWLWWLASSASSCKGRENRLKSGLLTGNHS